MMNKQCVFITFPTIKDFLVLSQTSTQEGFTLWYPILAVTIIFQLGKCYLSAMRHWIFTCNINPWILTWNLHSFTNMCSHIIWFTKGESTEKYHFFVVYFFWCMSLFSKILLHLLDVQNKIILVLFWEFLNSHDSFVVFYVRK